MIDMYRFLNKSHPIVSVVEIVIEHTSRETNCSIKRTLKNIQIYLFINLQAVPFEHETSS